MDVAVRFRSNRTMNRSRSSWIKRGKFSARVAIANVGIVSYGYLFHPNMFHCCLMISITFYATGLASTHRYRNAFGDNLATDVASRFPVEASTFLFSSFLSMDLCIKTGQLNNCTFMYTFTYQINSVMGLDRKRNEVL